MSEKICYIVGAGEISDLDFVSNSQDIVIAADGGYEYLKQAGISPHLIVGDFDSAQKAPQGENVLRLLPEKDDTDMYQAVRIGMDKGYRSFILYGGTGGRLSHTMANIQLLAYLAEQGCRGYLIGKKEILTVIYNSSLHFNTKAKGYISVFAHGGNCNVTLKNLKYPLTGYNMNCTYPIGVSNEFVSQSACVQANNGYLLVMFEKAKLNELIPHPFDV